MGFRSGDVWAAACRAVGGLAGLSLAAKADTVLCLYVAALVVVFALFGPGTTHAMPEDARHAGWYVAIGVGASRAATMQQAGDNRDTICYPTRDCRHLPGSMPSGYRWFYDLHPDTGAAFELAVGRTFRPVRLELAVSRQVIGLEQAFSGATYLDGSPIVPVADSGYTSTSTASVDDLTLHALSVNAYYDVPLSRSRITPYLGIGLGLSFAELSGLHFQSRYTCTGDTPCERPERYNAHQDVDLSDTVLAAHVHAGADYRLSHRLLLGLKLSYSLMGDMGSRDAYTYHGVPDLTNFTRISGINYWSFLLNLKYLLRNGSDHAP